MEDIVTVKEAADFLHRHPDTIRRWIENNKIKARKIAAGGKGVFVILRSDLLECLITIDLANKEKKERKSEKSFNINPPQELLPL